MTTTMLSSADGPEDVPPPVSHRVVGSRIRPPASQAVLDKTVAAAINVGLTEETATVLAHAAADQQQLRRALREKKIQRFGTEEFTYIEVDVLMWHVMPTPDNIRFEDEHAHGTNTMPRFSSVPGQALLTFQMRPATELIGQMSPRIADMAEHNPHIASIKDRGIETPGWLSFARITTEHGDVVRLETTDAFGRSVGAHEALGISFADVAFNLLPKTRRARSLHAQIAKWATADRVSDVEAQRVRCAIMPNARIIIGCNTEPYHLARRHFVAHLHMAPPMPFSAATMLNAKANTAIDKLHDRGLLPDLAELNIDAIRRILDGTDRRHELLPDEVAVLACSALNPDHRSRQARTVNEAIADLTGIAPSVQDRTLIAAEVALRGRSNDAALTARRSALERAWRLADLRGVSLTRRTPHELLAGALFDLVQQPDRPSAARSELATLATYHLVAGTRQVLVRSAHGARGDVAEPPKVIAALSRTSSGLRQLCQVVLDGRAGRELQRLSEGADPADQIWPEADTLTPTTLRELAEQPDPGVTYETPEQKYALMVDRFQRAVDDLHTAAHAVAEVEDTDGEPIVETRGYPNAQVQEDLDEIRDMVTVWRATYKKAARLQAKLAADPSGAR